MRDGATVNRAVKEGMVRRRFIKYLLGAMSALFASSAIAVTLRYLLSPQRTSEIEKVVEIARVGEIPIGGYKERWSFQGFPAILMHHQGGYKSFATKCTHLGCTASWRKEGWPAIGKREAVLFCPCHDGVFDHETGEVLAGPPPSPLPEILVEERGGMVVAIAWKDPEYVNSLPMYKK
jgi:Rieske Fe-S protein